jgi:predicted kinase
VILDATWARGFHRAQARRAALESGARLVEIECHADPDTTVERLLAREVHGLDASDATATLVCASRDPWPSATRIDTLDPVAEVCERAVALILEG